MRCRHVIWEVALLVIVLSAVAVYAAPIDDILEIADKHSFEDRYDSAIVYGEKALDMAIREFGADDTVTARVMDHICWYYILTKDLDRVGELVNGSMEIRSRYFSDSSLEIAESRHYLALYYNWKRDYPLAEKTMRQSLAVRKKLLGADSYEVGENVYYLALIIKNLDRVYEAKDLYEEALRIRQNHLGLYHIKTVGAIINLAIVCERIGQMDRAEELYIMGLESVEAIYGLENMTAAKLMNNLAGICAGKGLYDKAEEYINRAIGIKTKLVGRDNTDTGNSIRLLANLNMTLQNYSRAQRLLDECVDIYVKVYGQNHYRTGEVLDELGRAYFALGNYDRAEELFKSAIRNNRNYYRDDHYNEINSNIYLARINVKQGHYDHAEYYFDKAIQICNKIFGPDHYFTAPILLERAEVLSMHGEYKEAEEMAYKALAIREKTFGRETGIYTDGLEYLARIKQNQGDWDGALAIGREIYLQRSEDFNHNAYILSERDALKFSQLIKAAVDNYLSYYIEKDNHDEQSRLKIINAVLNSKGIVTDVVLERNRTFDLEKAPDVTAAADSLRYAKYQLSKHFTMGQISRTKNDLRQIDSLTHLATRLEGNLARLSARFRNHQNVNLTHAETLTANLPDESALIDYYRFKYYRPGTNEEPDQYLALCLVPDQNPRIVFLGDADKIDNAVYEYRKHMLRLTSQKMKVTPADEAEYSRISNDLTKLIWTPLKQYIEDKEMIFIAPDGDLNLVSFGGLKESEKVYLAEDHLIHYISSSRDLVTSGLPEHSSSQGLLAIGDPDYDAPLIAEVGHTNGTSQASAGAGRYMLRNLRSGCLNLDSYFLNRLPGTADEINQIVSAWGLNGSEPASVYLGAEATEEAFKENASKVRIIHLATHGYFLDEGCMNIIDNGNIVRDDNSVLENPLLHSGLFFAGANTIGDIDDQAAVVDDGILTAFEVSAMDLNGVDMVVLSACETALGQIESGEGVYGLRKAFQMAGVNTVISTLWPVSDQYSWEMITKIYQPANNRNIAQLMHQAQLETIMELRENKLSDHPVFWGSYVAVGKWSN